VVIIATMGKTIKACVICAKVISLGELTVGKGKCSSCRGETKGEPKRKPKKKPVDDIPSEDSSEDEMKYKCKRLEKRVKKLEKTVAELSNKLESAASKTFGIEKMIEGFMLGMKIGQCDDSANIVELSDG
jgi:predicted RNase H-like nuclease (RuvC/YqgF family)